MKKTIRSNSFAARLTPAQRDELFEAITAGLSYHDAAKKIRDWITANDAAGRNGPRPVRPLKLSEATTIGKWYHATATERRHALVAEVAKVAQAHCPADYEAQGRRALGQARYLATLEGLSVADIVMLERSELARDKLALEREKLAYQQRRDLVAEKTRLLLARTRGGEKGAELQRQIDLVLAEIERIQAGDAAGVTPIQTSNVEPFPLNAGKITGRDASPPAATSSMAAAS